MTDQVETIRVQLNYPLEQVKEPIVYHLVTDYRLVPNIRRANIDIHTGGFLFLELAGTRDDLNAGLDWLRGIGIEVSSIGVDGADEWVVR